MDKVVAAVQSRDTILVITEHGKIIEVRHNDIDRIRINISLLATLEGFLHS